MESEAKQTLQLVKRRAGLTLEGDSLTLRGDLTRLLPRLKPHNLGGELLVKAARIRGVDHMPIAVDATAGLGEDSLLLAAAGFEVYLFEQDPVIGALLEDSLKRGAQVPELTGIIGRMHLTMGDSIRGMRELPFQPDVIYLDPMFPGRTKSGLVKKKFQLLHELESPCEQEEELLAAAMDAGPKKIVIKRPLKGAVLGNTRPSYSLKGKAIRYDCIVMGQDFPQK